MTNGRVAAAVPAEDSVDLETRAVLAALDELGWSVATLGERMGEVLGRGPLSRSYTHRLIHGQVRCTAEKWRAMALAMGCRVPQLLLRDYGRTGVAA